MADESQTEEHRGGLNGRRALIALAVWALGALVFFRGPIFSGFRWMTGDPGDWRLGIFLAEHWRLVLTGAAPWPWWRPPYFAPAPDSMTFTDPSFGLAFPYIALRAAGLDEYVSFQLTVMAYSLAGFLAFAALALRVARAPFALALFGAAGFAFSNMNYAKLGHPIYAPVGLLALLVLLYARAMAALPASPRRAHLFGLLGALLFGYLLFTCFQVAWYGALVALATIVVLAVAMPGALRQAVGAVGPGRLAVFAAVQAALLVVAALPFLSVFAANWLGGAERPYWAVLIYAARPLDLFNVGGANLLWGRLVRLTGRLASPDDLNSEFGLAQTPIVGAVFLVLLWFLWRERRRNAGDLRMPGIVAAGIAAVVLAPFAFKIGTASGWWLLRQLVPGASAIRTPFRLQLALALPHWLLIVAGAAVLRAQLAARLAAAAPALHRAVSAGLVLLGALMLAEQVNLADQAWVDRPGEIARIARVPPAPPECRQFFVTSTEPQRSVFALQTDAMMIVLRERIATLNGNSGAWPPQWRLHEVHEPEYLGNAAAWARANRLDAGSGLCRLVLPGGEWSAWSPP